MEQPSSWDRLPHSLWKRGGGGGLSWARGKVHCLSLEGGGGGSLEEAKFIFKTIFLFPAYLKVSLKF